MFKTKSSLIALLVTLILTVSAIAVAAQTPNFVHTVAKVSSPPVIDGALNDAAWLQASQKGSKVVVDLHSTASHLTPYPRVGYLAYDDHALYVAVIAYEPNIDALTTDPDRPWTTDEIEIFIAAPEDAGHHQIVATFAGDDAHLTRGTIKATELEYEIATQVGEINWTIEVAIPFDSIGFKPAAGDEWKFNLTGNQVASGNGYISWNPTYGGFQNAARFATIVFGD